MQPAAMRANELATPEFFEACKNAPNGAMADSFLPNAPLRANAAAAQWISAHLRIARPAPSRGGALVVFIAPTVFSNLFGQRIAGFGGCAAELVGDKLYVLDGLQKRDFEEHHVIVL